MIPATATTPAEPMTTTMIKLSAIWILVGLAGTGLFYGAMSQIAAVNFIAGYLCGSIVLAASAFGYWQLVSHAGESSAHHDLPDAVERIDDRFGLWDEAEESIEDAAEALKREKARMKERRRGLKEIFRTASPALSLYRLGAYALLIFVVYRLIRDDLFSPVPFLVGAGAGPMTAALYLFLRGGKVRR